MLSHFIQLSLVSITFCTLFQHVPKRERNELTDLMNDVLNEPLLKVSLTNRNVLRQQTHKSLVKESSLNSIVKPKNKGKDWKINLKPIKLGKKYPNVSSAIKKFNTVSKPKRSEILRIPKPVNTVDVKDEIGTLIVIDFDNPASDKYGRKRSEIQSSIPVDNLGYTIVLNNNGNDVSDTKKEKIFDELKEHFSEMEEQFQDFLDQGNSNNIMKELLPEKKEEEEIGSERDAVPNDPDIDRFKIVSDLKPKFVPFGKLTAQTKDSQLDVDIDKLKHVKENLKLLNEDENENFNATLKQPLNELKNFALKSLPSAGEGAGRSTGENRSSNNTSNENENKETFDRNQNNEYTKERNFEEAKFTPSIFNYSSLSDDNLELKSMNQSNEKDRNDENLKGDTKFEVKSDFKIKNDIPDYPVKNNETQLSETILESSKDLSENLMSQNGDADNLMASNKISDNTPIKKESPKNGETATKVEEAKVMYKQNDVKETPSNESKNEEDSNHPHEKLKLKLVSINTDNEKQDEIRRSSAENKNESEHSFDEIKIEKVDSEESLNKLFIKKTRHKVYNELGNDFYNAKKPEKEGKIENEDEVIQSKQNSMQFKTDDVTLIKPLSLNTEQNKLKVPFTNGPDNMYEKARWKFRSEEAHRSESNQRHEISWLDHADLKTDNSNIEKVEILSKSKPSRQKAANVQKITQTYLAPANPSPKKELNEFEDSDTSSPSPRHKIYPTRSSTHHPTPTPTQKQVKITPTRKIPAVKRSTSNPVTKIPIISPEPKVLDKRKAEAIIEFLNKDPLESWRYHFHTLKSLDLNSSILRSGLVNAGNIDRLKGVMRRALEGKDITLSIIGGSISAGGGLYKDRGNIDGLFYKGLVDWWNKMITPLTGSDMIVNNIAIGSIGTDYFSYCVKNHIATETDIVLWELAANDFNRYKMQPTKGARPLERLTRMILELQNKPALLYINFFKGVDFKASRDSCPNFEDQGEDIIAHYYKIPSLSWRAMVCGALVRNEPGYSIETLFSLDQYHPSLRGHAQMSLLLLLHLRHVMRAVLQWAIDHNGYIDRFEDKYTLPEPLFMGLKSPEPLCWTLITADLNEKVTNSLKVKIVKENGFKLEYATNFPIRFDKVICWKAEHPGALIAIQFYIPEKYSANGSKRLRSEVAITTHTRWGGSSTIWVDNMTDKQIVIKEGRPNDPGKRTQVDSITNDLGPGTHTLNVLSHEGAFCLAAIMIDSS